jgi:hypothetical protein
VNLFDDVESSGRDDNVDGIVFVQWQAAVNDALNRVVDGQTQICVKVHKTNEEQSDLDEFAALSDPATLLEVSLNKEKHDENETSFEAKVTCTLIYPAMVEHNFQREKFCVVPVTLLLHSIVNDADLNVIINTLGAARYFRFSSRLVDDFWFLADHLHFYILICFIHTLPKISLGSGPEVLSEN